MKIGETQGYCQFHSSIHTFLGKFLFCILIIMNIEYIDFRYLSNKVLITPLTFFIYRVDKHKKSLLILPNYSN